MAITEEQASKDYAITLDEEDLAYEEDVLRNQYSVKSWTKYLDHKLNSVPHNRFIIYQRAIRELPSSYKLWYSYLKELIIYSNYRSPNDPIFNFINQTFEKCLFYLHKMPRIWLEYSSFLIKQKKITQTRRTFDRALQSLPLLQHDRIWKSYLNFVREVNIPEVVIRVYRRYLKYDTIHIEDYIEYLIEKGFLEEASKCLVRIVNDEHFTSQKGKSRHQLWMQLCDIISKNPKEIDQSIDVESIIRNGFQIFIDEVGHLWTALGNYFIRIGMFEKARSIFEEGLNTVMTVRDLSQIWDAYTKFEESYLTALIKKSDSNDEQNFELELLMERFTHLISRRALLVSSVLLRQNPNNVSEWHKRAKLLTDPKEIVETYTTALKTVDSKQATNPINTLWYALAKVYEREDDIDSVRKIFEKAIVYPFRSVEELANIYCDYAEMELRQKQYNRARQILRRAVESPPQSLIRKLKNLKENILPSQRVYKSIRIWSFLTDLEESLGTFESTKECYEKMIDLKIITPQIIINYAEFLEQNKYFEDAFRAYEKGLHFFENPFVLDLWIIYLTKFVKRYGGKKLERARDLFEQAISKAPADSVIVLYVLYARLEEQYGLARHAMAIYDRATRAVSSDDKYKMYMLYISRASELFGVTRTREIYEKAIESLPESNVKDICLRFADMERKLGEIDRARAIYIHSSQFCDPNTEKKFWQTWHEFEVRHGNEETFREMLRIKRSVQAQFNTQVNLMSAEMIAENSKAETDENGIQRKPFDNMIELERQAQTIAEKRSASDIDKYRLNQFTKSQTKSKNINNPDEINLGEEENDDNDNDNDNNNGNDNNDNDSESESNENEAQESIDIEQRNLPESIFGSKLLQQGETIMGAKERLKKRKQLN
eukprot:TRINITY_DN1366_c0_g5_i1.p1 TRINITY_DN1366_c0_g5~~TRINITY_DN1366_c0_g5_i1.p1  ORF type:complete len:900 (-),score=376.69 TRINITY_DN1366_c0_g5_i1:36-2699(-)